MINEDVMKEIEAELPYVPPFREPGAPGFANIPDDHYLLVRTGEESFNFLRWQGSSDHLFLPSDQDNFRDAYFSLTTYCNIDDRIKVGRKFFNVADISPLENSRNK